MKKCLFIVLALFGLNAFADMHSGMDHMSDMVSSDGDSGFNGSFSLRYKPIGFDAEGVDDLTYRARLGWNGDLNEHVHWNVSLSTNTEQNFETIGLSAIHLEQAYVSYKPMDGVSIKVGKYGWMPNFHKKGILYSEQLYHNGVTLKYDHSADDDMGRMYAKVALYKLDGEKNKPFAEGVTLKGKLGGSYGVSDDMNLGVYVSGAYDGLMQKKKEGEDSVEAKTLAQLGFHLTASNMPVPVGLFGIYLTDAKGLTKFNSYTAGISVGQAGKADSVEMGDFGLAASYYDIKADDFTAGWLNEDYVSGAGKGVAVRAQYNPWDSTSLVAKYAHNLDKSAEDPHNLIAELMFVF